MPFSGPAMTVKCKTLARWEGVVPWQLRSMTRARLFGGASYPNGPGQDAIIWKHGVMTDLPPHGWCNIANNVNSRDQAVGLFSTTCGGPGGAALWEDGTLVDLNTFNYPGLGIPAALSGVQHK